jgi:hypothetical protein
VVLENIQDVFVLEQLLFEVVGRVATMRELDPCDAALLLCILKFDMYSSAFAGKQNNSNLVAFLGLFFRLQSEGFAELSPWYVITRFSS